MSNMGRGALLSHSKVKDTKKAMALVEGPTVLQFVKTKQVSKEIESVKDTLLTADEPHSSQQGKSVPGQQCSMKAFTTNESVMKAEILWSSKSVMAHFSFSASAGIGDLFKRMFPDSQIASEFAYGKTKMNYLLCFGIIPFFKEKLLQKVKEAECVTVSFDESLNKDFQSEQMNTILHYFNEDKCLSQYSDSQFMGHTTAKDLLENLKSTLSKLNNRKLLQISMDAPRVNCKLLSLLDEDREKENADLPQLLNVGSCGLHVVHGTFCTGCQSTDWKIDSFLRALWYLFHNSLARRGDFTAVTGSTVFPLQFCAMRWVEDEKVAERAIEIWPNTEQYITHVLKETKNKHPTSASFTTVQKGTKDPLLVAKLQVFVYIAKVLKPFFLSTRLMHQ